MNTDFQARRISKPRADKAKKSGLGRAVLLNTCNGFILVEPVGADLGDGEVLSAYEADYELQPVWHLGPQATLREARRRLGLEASAEARQMSGSGV